VLVDDGAIVVLGGLLQDEFSGNEDKVPGLGDVPLLGNLFKSNTRSRKKTNLMVFLRPVVLREVTPATWSALLNNARAAESPARRGFFRALTQQPAGVLIGAPSEPGRAQAKELAKPPGEYLPDGDDALMPWVIRLNAMHCVGCHACSRVCPEDAIQFDAAAQAYRLRHRACTGCGLCQDVGQHHAISLQPWAEPAQWTLPLVEQRCPCCGVAFHPPIQSASRTRTCWVCASTKLKRLFQVMA
jgi:Pyruvate/2-oxoacid:ferredoxin oxidoreductase delta subunit